MYRSSEIMLVQIAKLPTFPQGFQNYVQKYFEIKNIDGIDYYFAFREPFFNHRDFKVKGIAPIDMPDKYQEFCIGLTDGKGLEDWIYTQMNYSDQAGFIILGKSWNRKHALSFP